MPVIRIDGPKVESMDKKRRFVKDITKAASALFGLPTQMIIVLFRENTPDNVGVGGLLLSDRHKSD